MNEDLQFDFLDPTNDQLATAAIRSKKKKKGKKTERPPKVFSCAGSAVSNKRKVRGSSRGSNGGHSKEETPQFAGGFGSSGVNHGRRRGSSAM